MNASFTPRTTLPSLFHHQEDAIAGTLAELEIADRCKVLMACATGKTRVGPEIAIARGARTVIVYLPSLALMRQTLPTWIASNDQFIGGMSYLCVCSDSTVVPGSDEDEPVVTADDLIAEFHLEKKAVTTHGADVHEFLTHPGFGGVRIIFSTYQSSDVVRDGCPEGFKFDLGIFDEAHRTAGKGSAFSAPLLDSHTPIAKRVFMTATPKHLNIRRKKDSEATVAYSMDDETIYGRTAYNLPIREAIDLGIIANYQILVSVIDDKMISSQWSEGHVLAKEGGVNAKSIAHALAIRDAMIRYGVKKVVTFHNLVEDARQFAAHPIIQQELGAQTFHVNGSIPTGMRGAIMDRFASASKGLVTNARCLTEGVDVPEIDMVAFLYPKNSQIDIIQAIGRALRMPQGSDKTTGYILLPLYVSQIENGGLDRALDESGYDTIYQVIQALREQDAVVDIAIRDAAMARAIGEPFNLDFIKITGPSIHLDLLRDAITTQCLDVLGDTWDGMFGRVKKFTEHYGHAKVPVSYKAADGYSAGSWVSTQRKKKDNLSSERKARLESLPGWSWDLWSEQWEDGFLRTKEFAGREGHAKVPQSYKTADGYPLGSWVRIQRKKRKGNLSSERKARLESLPSWSWDLFSDQWEEGFQKFKECAVINGDIKITEHDKSADGYPVGTWATRQRSTKDSMSPERKARLEGLPGWSWDLLSYQWEEGFQKTKEFAGREGHTRVPYEYKTADGYPVGKWVSRQRSAKDSLSPERKARLEALTGWSWDLLSDRWEEGFQKTKEFAGREGHARVPSGYKTADGNPVGKWVSHQRTNKDRMSPERKARLEALPGWSW